MTKRKGTFLEETIATLFKRAGFNVQLNTKRFGFEVDVYAHKKDFNIIIECKQYENSYINIGSLLHEWASKGKSASADKIVVVIAGQIIPEKFYHLASNLGIILLDNEMVHGLNLMDNQDVKEALNDMIRFDEKSYYLKQKKLFFKKLKIIGITLFFFIIVLLILFNLFNLILQGSKNISSNFSITPGNQGNISQIEVSVQELCLVKFKEFGIYDLNNPEILTDEPTAFLWIDSKYLYESSRRIAKDKIINKELPIVVVDGSRKIDAQLVEHGTYYCNNGGVL